MHQTNEPLGKRLRHAAIDRTMTDSERVDDFVLDADGVIDLRQLEKDHSVGSIADPAAALSTVRGKLGDAGEISDLYDESELPKPRWRLGLRARREFGDSVSSVPTAPSKKATPSTPPPSTAPIGRLSKVAISPEFIPDTTPVPADTDVYESSISAVTETPGADDNLAAEIDLRDEARPTADCPKCAGLGHRDLFDRFSQVEFYSCDHCKHMWQQDAR